MDKEVIKKYKKEFNSWLDGEEVEFQNESHKWALCTGVHSWNFEGEYRIKPREPRVFWVNLYLNEEMSIHNTVNKVNGSSVYGCNTIKVVEVIDE